MRLGDSVAKLKNERQEKFCLEYIKSDNATQSAINAGYSKKTARTIGSKLLTNIDIQDRFQELMKKNKKKNKLIADAEEVLEFFSKTFRNELKAKKFIEEGKTVEVDINVETRDRLKAAEMLGKKYAMFTDNMNVKAEIKESKIDKLLTNFEITTDK